MLREIKPGIYEHYRGKRYRVLSIARHSETLEKLVIYEALYESPEFGKNSLWARPLKMFQENVILNNKSVPRFKFISH